ncbi:AAA family ATPase [Vibrio sp. PP-XX7]
MKSYVQTILSMGTNVVMDFPANTKQQRQWFLALASEINATHTLIFLNVSDEQCLKQIAQRRREHPERAAFDTADFFHQVTQYFGVPNESEGLNILEIRGE